VNLYGYPAIFILKVAFIGWQLCDSDNVLWTSQPYVTEQHGGEDQNTASIKYPMPSTMRTNAQYHENKIPNAQNHVYNAVGNREICTSLAHH
jgi:hypothetical protein